jgi:hypothetical protein
VYRRIKAKLAEAADGLRQAARAAQPSTSQMLIRLKGKQTEAIHTEAMNQYKQLKEDELRCELLQ